MRVSTMYISLKNIIQKQNKKSFAFLYFPIDLLIWLAVFILRSLCTLCLLACHVRVTIQMTWVFVVVYGWHLSSPNLHPCVWFYKNQLGLILFETESVILQMLTERTERTLLWNGLSLAKMWREHESRHSSSSTSLMLTCDSPLRQNQPSES